MHRSCGFLHYSILFFLRSLVAAQKFIYFCTSQYLRIWLVFFCFEIVQLFDCKTLDQKSRIECFWLTRMEIFYASFQARIKFTPQYVIVHLCTGGVALIKYSWNLICHQFGSKLLLEWYLMFQWVNMYLIITVASFGRHTIDRMASWQKEKWRLTEKNFN